MLYIEGDRLTEEIIRKYKEKKTRSISSSSSSSSYGSSFVGVGGGYAGAFCGGVGGLFSCGGASSTSSTPTNTVTSGLGSSDHSGPTLDALSSSARPYYLKHVITSRKSFNREIKSLLDIAENKTRVLCKVYDSAMSEECSVTAPSPRSAVLRPRAASKDQNALLSKDYRKIIDMNYSNLRKKQSNVLNKVKLWDQMLESGSLNIASWGKNFFEFS